MIEQIIAGVVGGLCGFWIEWQITRAVKGYALAHNLEFEGVPFHFIIASITGAYLFVKWFC